ncbi:Hypothetical protein FKW44_008696 [Caligus rogercresseyi]|uniref:Uncharacterized protein n=1 Tax=Caligus rogercresseyi TaxID=217165 RepID=A0A7T8KGR3_CALRO|nr:Hypothetical protein FKW44_008696 [Caligus rogercresseyi]
MPEEQEREETTCLLSAFEEEDLRRTLIDLVTEAHPALPTKDLDDHVEKHFPQAASKYPKYQKAAAICRHLDSSDKGDRELEVKLFFAKLSRGRSELEELRSLTYAASRYWYNIGKEPFTSAFINASDKIEDIAVRGEIGAERHNLHIPLMLTNPKTITVEREKKPALHYDAAKVIGSKFSGEARLRKCFGLTRSLKKWTLRRETLNKFKDCLEGKAHLLVNESASYQQAIEELDKTYEDSFKLAKAYLDEVKKVHPSRIFKKLQSCVESGGSILEDAQARGVNPVDFLLITFVNCKLPAPSRLRVDSKCH